MTTALYNVKIQPVGSPETYEFKVLATGYDDADRRAREYVNVLGITGDVSVIVDFPPRDANDMLDDFRTAETDFRARAYIWELDEYLSNGGDLPDAWTTTRDNA